MLRITGYDTHCYLSIIKSHCIGYSKFQYNKPNTNNYKSINNKLNSKLWMKMC